MIPPYFKNAYTNMQTHLKKNPTQDDLNVNREFKYARGYWRVYDCIFDYLGTNVDVCECGIGNGASHMRWSFLTTGKVIGLEFDSADFDRIMTNHNQPEANPNAQRNYTNASKLIENSVDKNQFDYRYERDAFDPNTAQEIMHDYPELKFIVNDSKHRNWAGVTFLKAWEPYMHPDGILIQEDISRQPGMSEEENFEWADPKWIEKSLEEGWIVYDFRNVTTFTDETITEEYWRGSVLGVYYKNPQWAEVLKPADEFKVTLDNWQEVKHTWIDYSDFKSRAKNL